MEREAGNKSEPTKEEVTHFLRSPRWRRALPPPLLDLALIDLRCVYGGRRGTRRWGARGRSRGDWVGRRQGIREEATAASAGGAVIVHLDAPPLVGGKAGGGEEGVGEAGEGGVMSRVLTGGETENLLKGGGDVPTGE